MIAVSRETQAKLDAYAAAVVAENERQNLISRSTIADFATRHIADSLQLLDLAPRTGVWLDIGSGAGLPGIPLAIAGGMPIHLVEPRRRRSEFLSNIVVNLRLSAVVHACRVESVAAFRADVITARAVAPLDTLFTLAARFSHPGTVWLLPKGRSAESELASARARWQGDFALVASATAPESSIVVARNLTLKP